MKKEMLINCLQSEEIRIAIIENGVLEELYVERASAESYVGNIYKGRVVNIEPSIQAAFVDFGVGRNGFLHVSDVEPAYYKELEDRHGRRGERGDRGDRGDRGRGRSQRPRDDYDAPRREQRAPRQEPRFEEELAESPVVPAPSSFLQPPPDMHTEEGQDIIVEEIYEEEDAFEDPPMIHEPSEPKGEDVASEETLEELSDDPEPPFEDESPASLFDEVAPTAEAPSEEPAEESNEDAAEEVAPAGEVEGEEEEEKPKRRGQRRPRGKSTGRARKPRKTTPESEPPPDEGPKPRPMDSSERRTSEEDPPLTPIQPRPSANDLSDDDLSFSKAPPPQPSAPPAPPAEFRYDPPPLGEPVDDIIVQEEEFIEPEGESEEITSEPMAPAIPKVEPSESFEELAEEEKAMEEEEIVVSEIGAEDAPRPGADDDFSDIEEYVPRERGRGARSRDDRGPRGRDDRRGGGRGRDDRRGPRGRDDRRGGGRDQGRRPSGGGRPPFGRPKPNIEDIFKRGQEVLVQVIKEGIGTKGPTLSTYISIAGRYLVLMPGLNRIGVSRKIDDEETRRRLREIMNELKPPRGIGFIIRTAGQDRNRKELQSDLAYLSRLWQVVAKRIQKQKAPCEIYRESDMVTRTIRDIFTDDIGTIWVDEQGAYEAAKEFMEAVMPRYADRIKFYDGTVPMFHKHGIEAEIARIQERKISLPYGGSIVIDQTEALVAIDVNSGSFRADNNNAEETAYQMNLQAAKEIARQLRLRDLGGVIANDFIDMRQENHRRGVEKALRDAVRRDRARTKILRISQFGIIEMTRQRIRPSLKRSAFQECAHCKGTGNVKTWESVSIEVMRMLQLAVNREQISRIDIRTHDEVAKYLLNKKRKDIVLLEEQSKKPVSITSAGASVSPEFLEFLCYDNNGNEVKFAIIEEPPPRPPHRRGRR